MKDRDLVIIGAGACGLLLLLELYEQGYQGSVSILEQASTPSDDRIWSFWDNQLLPSYLRKHVDYRWRKWQLSSGHGSRVMCDHDHTYCSLRSSTLRCLVQNLVAKMPNFSIVYACKVNQVSPTRHAQIVSSSDGDYTARKVIDTRPPKLHSHHKGLFQCFLGTEVVLKKDTFTSDTVSLMKNIENTPNGLRFVYILPFSASHALIELTYFSAQAIAPDSLRDELEAKIKEILHSEDYKSVREEKGVLPMYAIDLNEQNKQSNMVYGGIAGGAMRASTGYSFVNSHRWATRVVQQLVNNEQLRHQRPISLLYRLLDSAFLRVLRSSPELSVLLYSRLFQRMSVRGFIHFMSENASYSQIFQVIWAMPKWSFTLALIKSYFWGNRAKHGS